LKSSLPGARCVVKHNALLKGTWGFCGTRRVEACGIDGIGWAAYLTCPERVRGGERESESKHHFAG